MSLLLLFASSLGGGYTVEFRVTPPSRYDATSWTTLLVEEATLRDGPWTTLIDEPLPEVDQDPASPELHEITITGATLAAGWYRMTFGDADESLAPPVVVFNAHNIRPGLPDIAKRLRSRLTDSGGNPVEFSDTTAPSRADVEGFITSGIRRIRLKVGGVPDGIADDAREAVELYAAAQTEIARWPEQAGTVNSPYDALMRQFDLVLADLVLATRTDVDAIQKTFQPIGIWSGRGIFRDPKGRM